jgi:hypothetical protein
MRARAAVVGEAVLTPRGVEYAGSDMWLLEAAGGERSLNDGRLVEHYASAPEREASRYGWISFEIPSATASARPARAGEPVVTAYGLRTARADEWLVHGPGGTYHFPAPVFHGLYRAGPSKGHTS